MISGGSPTCHAGIVELLRVVAQVLVVEQAFDRRRPEQRAEAHLRRSLADHRHDVLGILGRARQAGVFEVIDAGGEPAPDLLGTMRVGDDREAVFVRLVDDGRDLVHASSGPGRSA